VSSIVTVNNEEVKRMNLNVPVRLHNDFKAATAARGQNMTDELLKFLRGYVDKYSSKRTRRRK
jgi:hypothetical protein